MAMIERIRLWLFKRKIENALGVLRYLDDVLILKGYTRGYRRTFWREFVASIDLRNDIRAYVKEQLKDIYSEVLTKQKK